MTTISEHFAEFDKIWSRFLAKEDDLGKILAELAATIDGPPGKRGRSAAFQEQQRAIAALRLHLRLHLNALESIRTTLGSIPPNTLTSLEVRRLADLRAKLGAATRRYLTWGRIGPAIADAMRFRGHPLEDRVDEGRLDLASHLVRTLSDGFGRLHAIANPAWEREAVDGFGAFADIPMNAAAFASMALAAWRIAQAVERRDRLRFLDVGCGGGLRVVQAAQIFDEAHGLDYGEAYVRAARRVLKAASPDRTAVFRADARSFEGYDTYDVIYFYRPMQDPEGLLALEDRILERARPGTVLIAPYQQFEVRPPVTRVSGVCHVVGLTDARTAKVARTAERIGLRPKSFVQTRWMETGPYLPLVQALDRNGFAVI